MARRDEVLTLVDPAGRLWPLALLALLLYPFISLVQLPFRLVGIAVDGVFGLLTGIILLPPRLLSGPSKA